MNDSKMHLGSDIELEKYTQDMVDQWVTENGESDAYSLLSEMLPKHHAKLSKLDKRIADLLNEIREVFPDAQYYTASGGFHLILGDTHDGVYAIAQPQRTGWNGNKACIGDGDW